MDRRRFTRVAFKTEATVECGDQTITGEVENLSLKGMLLKTHVKLNAEESVKIDIRLSGSTTQLSISTSGVVIRNTSTGIAFRFSSMDLDSFIHLKNIIAYNEGDDAKVMEEFYHFTG